MDVDIPNIYHYNAMEIAIHHNNGTNCRRLANNGVHNIELRAARQNYVTSKGVVDLEVVKVRVKCAHKSTEKGSIETDNPYGSTEKYSVIRYEEELEGEVWNLIDSTAGIIFINGKDYSSDLKSLLD
jgi:phage tail tube protein FII